MKEKLISIITCFLFAFGPAIVLFTAVGCDDKTDSRVVQRKVTADKGNLPLTDVEIGYSKLRIVTATHDQHRYVIFFYQGTGAHAIHDPDCPCRLSSK